MEYDLSALFKPFSCGSLNLDDRIVMAPMTRSFSPGGVPGPDVAAYYRRRAEAGTGLIITECTKIPHPAAFDQEGVPHIYGEDALNGWARVVAEVHAAGGKIMPQLCHTGLTHRPEVENLVEGVEKEDFSAKVSPSGYAGVGDKVAEPITDRQVEEIIEAYANGAENAKALGADGLEIHGGHGLIVDQFFWHETNKRTDRWGGETLAERARFGVEMIKACRAKVGSDFPILLRFSQWKFQHYTAKLAQTPQELATLLEPLAQAGVDMFHASQRRFWEPEFPGSDLNLAGWAKKITGKPSITVGSVGIEQEMLDSLFSPDAGSVPTTMGKIDRLVQMLDRGDFDLVAVGRALLVDPEWAKKMRRAAYTELLPFSRASLANLF